MIELKNSIVVGVLGSKATIEVHTPQPGLAPPRKEAGDLRGGGLPASTGRGFGVDSLDDEEKPCGS